MEITSINSFLKYYKRIKERTQRLIDSIPEENIEWTYQQGKFTIGDVIRHIAAIERFMYAENVQNKPSLYNGCGKELAEGYIGVKSFFDKMHDESVLIFQTLSDTDLNKKCKTPAGNEITIWKWLRAMVEHEIHHRAQLFIYLGILEIKTPPLFGLTAEEVEENYCKI